MELKTVKLINEKEFNSKVKILFGNEEKSKLYFLKKFLKQLERECEKTTFVLKKDFSENKVIIALSSKTIKEEMKYSLYPTGKGIKIVFRNATGKDRDDEEFLEDNLVPFVKDKVSNKFQLNYWNYSNIVFRTMEKLIVEEKLKEYPQNYALKEYFYVLEKIPFDFKIYAKFKISELLEAKAYPKLLEMKYKIKLRKNIEESRLNFLILCLFQT